MCGGCGVDAPTLEFLYYYIPRSSTRLSGARSGSRRDVLVGGIGARGGVSTQAWVHLAAVLKEAPQLRSSHDPSDKAPCGHAAPVHAGAGVCAW